MNTKVKGNLLLNADIVTPETPYATFNDSLAKQAKNDLCLAINFGSKMLQVYEANRDNLHIVNVVKVLQEMEEVFRKFDYERFAARRDR